MTDYFKGLGEALVLLMWVSAISAPLAIWKLIDIALWLYAHIDISWSTK